MKIYTIIGGVNGVGKSSLTGVLASESNDLGVIIDTDKITALQRESILLRKQPFQVHAYLKPLREQESLTTSYGFIM